MKSVRLGAELETRLREAAARSGLTESEIIRQAVAERCDALLETTLADRIGEIIGSVQGDGSGWTRDAGAAYARSLASARAAGAPRRKPRTRAAR